MSSFDRDPFILIADLARLIRARVDQRARMHDMTRTQWVILTRVETRPGLSQSELASLCEVEPITIVRLIDRLEVRGFLERRRDPDDRRIRRLYTKPAAHPIVKEIHAAWAEIKAEATAGLTEPAVSAVIDGLLTMKVNLGGRDQDQPGQNQDQLTAAG